MTISDEQFDLWEEQLRQELNPSSSWSSSSPTSSPIRASSGSSSISRQEAPRSVSQPGVNLNETNYFDDSDDDILLEAADQFEVTRATDKSLNNCDTILIDEDEDSPIKRRPSKPIRRVLSSSSLSGCENKPSTSQYFSQKVKKKKKPQRKGRVLQLDSDEDDDDDDEDEEDKENINIIQHWVGEKDLSRQIRQNDQAMRILKNRARRKANPFIEDEADDAFDTVECFDDTPDMNIDTQMMYHDRSMMEFVSDENDYGGASANHLQSLLSQNQDVCIPEMFRRRAPAGDISILSDTDEEDRLDEEEEDDYDDSEDSFVDDEIQYVTDKTPKKAIQTQQMRLRSKRLIDRRGARQAETPEQPKRRRRIVIESP